MNREDPSWGSFYFLIMEDKILNIVLFIIVFALTIILTPIITLLVILFGSFILTYFIVTYFYEKLISKKVKELGDNDV